MPRIWAPATWPAPTHHDSFRSMCSSFCATLSTPTAASGWRSWLLMEMSASTAVCGDDWNSSSL